MRIWGEVRRRGRNALQVWWKDFGWPRKGFYTVPKCRFHPSLVQWSLPGNLTIVDEQKSRCA